MGAEVLGKKGTGGCGVEQWRRVTTNRVVEGDEKKVFERKTFHFE